MKLIDVLNMIVKGELEEGTEFKFAGHTYFYKRGVLYDREINAGKLDWISMRMLCDEVEIIGHATNVATKIREVHYTVGALEHPSYNESWLMNCVRANRDKLNEVIRELNRRSE